MFLDVFILPLLELIVILVISPLFSLFLWLKNLIVHPIKNLYFWIIVFWSIIFWGFSDQKYVKPIVGIILPEEIVSVGAFIFIFNLIQWVPNYLRGEASKSTQKYYMTKNLKCKILHEKFWIKRYLAAPITILSILSGMSLVFVFFLEKYDFVERLIQEMHITWLARLIENKVFTYLYLGLASMFLTFSLCIFLTCVLKNFRQDFIDSKTNIEDDEENMQFIRDMVCRESEEKFSALFRFKYESSKFSQENIDKMISDIFKTAKNNCEEERAEYIKIVFKAQQKSVYRKIKILNFLSSCPLYKDLFLKDELNKIDMFYREKWRTIYNLEEYKNYLNVLVEMMSDDLFTIFKFSDDIMKSEVFKNCFYSYVDENLFIKGYIKPIVINPTRKWTIKTYVQSCFYKFKDNNEIDYFKNQLDTFDKQMNLKIMRK